MMHCILTLVLFGRISVYKRCKELSDARQKGYRNKHTRSVRVIGLFGTDGCRGQQQSEDVLRRTKRMSRKALQNTLRDST